MGSSNATTEMWVSAGLTELNLQHFKAFLIPQRFQFNAHFTG